jgi:hypothetical protein
MTGYWIYFRRIIMRAFVSKVMVFDKPEASSKSPPPKLESFLKRNGHRWLAFCSECYE